MISTPPTQSVEPADASYRSQDCGEARDSSTDATGATKGSTSCDTLGASAELAVLPATRLHLDGSVFAFVGGYVKRLEASTDTQR